MDFKKTAFALIVSSIFILGTAHSAKAIALVPPDGSVTFAFNWTPTETSAHLGNNIYSYYANEGIVSGGLNDINPGVSSQNVGNPFQVHGTRAYGELGVYYSNTIPTGSVWVGFTDPLAITGRSFEDVFHAFLFNGNTSNGITEALIVSALKSPDSVFNPNGLTTDENGKLAYQFRDYVQDLTNTQAAVNTGQLTLLHFGNAAVFGAVGTAQVVTTPEPAAMSALLMGGAGLLGRRRSRAIRD